MFYLCVFFMMVVSGLFVLAPLIFRSSVAIERQDINLLVFQERLKEIEDEKPDNVAQLKSELKRELLFSAESKDRPIIETDSGALSLKLLSVLLPLISAFIYFDVGFGQGSIQDVFLAKNLRTATPRICLVIDFLFKRLSSEPKPSLKITISNFSWPEATQNWVILTRRSSNIGNYW